MPRRATWDKALADLNECLKLDGEMVEALFHRALVQAEKKQPDAALADYKRVILLDVRSPAEFKEWAGGEKRAAALIDEFEETFARRRDEAKALYKKGVEAHKANKFAEAIESYTKAVDLYPRYAEVYYNRGLAYRKLDKLAEALEDYSQAIQMDPRLAAAYSNRGYVYYKMGDLERALADFDQVLKLDPENEDARKSRAVIAAQRGGK